MRETRLHDEILGVLARSETPKRPVEVKEEIESRLQREVSYNTVASFLSVSARNPKSPIERVSPGLYEAE